MLGAWQLRVTAKSKEDNGSQEPKEFIPPEKLPESFYVGQDYIEDLEKVDVLIHFTFKSPVVFSNSNFSYRSLSVSQNQNGEVICIIKKTLSKKLFSELIDKKDINKLIRAINPIMGYIRLYLPTINAYIQEQKYLEGHILGRMISASDIYNVLVTDLNKKNGGLLPWPTPLTGFPPSKLTNKQDVVYTRDLIDAMSSYFQYNLDDCIRKVITSLENCFLHYELTLPPRSKQEWLKKLIFGKEYKIKKLINFYITENYYGYIERDLQKLRKNILFIYKLRNLIVHDKLRIHPSQTTICKKAIGTLLYLYQGSFIEKDRREYISSLHGQFMMIGEMYNGYSLEIIDWNNSLEKKNTRPNIINNKDDMDRFVFEGLSIKEKEEKSILSGQIEEHFPPNARM